MSSRALRVLHVHSDLLSGGVEQWLFHVTERVDRRKIEFSFYTATLSAAWETLIERQGLQLIRSPRPRVLWNYYRELRRTLCIYRYDVVHCHFVDHCGLVLREAHRAQVPVRIAHCHIDLAPVRKKLSLAARSYIRVQSRLMRRYATHGVAASAAAAGFMFGPHWRRDKRWSVLHCGVDLQAIAVEVDRNTIRRSIGFDPDDIVIGNVARLVQQKNHAFLVEIAESLRDRLPRARFLCVGEGPLEAEIRRKVAHAGLCERFRFVGIRPDIGALLHAMDAFIFPSLYEGLGLALVEAQAAGLRCFVSDTVPEEAMVVEPLVTRLPVRLGPVYWASSIERTMRMPAAVSPEHALHTVAGSAFNVDASVKALTELYGER